MDCQEIRETYGPPLHPTAPSGSSRTAAYSKGCKITAELIRKCMARFTKWEIQKFIKADGISATAAEQLRLFQAYCLERRRCHGSNPCLTPTWGIRSSAPPIISPLPWCHRPKILCAYKNALHNKRMVLSDQRIAESDPPVTQTDLKLFIDAVLSRKKL